MIEAILLFLIEGQDNITVNFVTDIEAHCNQAVIGCADIQNRQVYVQPGWGNMDSLIAHEAAHIILNETEHTPEFRHTVNLLRGEAS